jgi:predicted Zn-dependent protease
VAIAASTCAHAADPDMARARQLLGEGGYQQAYELLQPLRPTAGADAEFNRLLGEAALRTGRAEEAKARAAAVQKRSGT